MATGLYLTADGMVMVDYGARKLPISPAQYRANGYKPSFEKLHQEQKCRQQTNAVLVKRLPDAPYAADQRGDAEKQQCCSDDRASYLRLNNLGPRSGENEEGKHQFGRVTKADVEQAPNRAAGALRELFSGAADPIGHDANAGEAGNENPGSWRIGEVAKGQ